MRIDLRRREFIAGLGGAAAWPLAARAQQPQRVRRIGVLMNWAADDPESQARDTALRQALQELGWTDGRNVLIEYRCEVLAGLVERVTYQNADNGFCVVRVKARGHRDFGHAGQYAATISAGITATGGWVNDRTHGQQFRAARSKASRRLGTALSVAALPSCS
jgi:hypothetical protein